MVKSSKITSQTIRETKKRDLSPNWEGADKWIGEQFTKNFREAMNFYNLEFAAKDLKPKVIEWMVKTDYEKEAIQLFKQGKDWRCSQTVGAVAACLLKGMPEQHKDFNQGRNIVEWLKVQIEKITAESINDIEVVIEQKKSSAPVITIQDRIREQAIDMAADIESAIESFQTAPNDFDPKAFKMINMLRGKSCKAAQARYIKSFYEKDYAELLELASGNADEQLREGYQHYARKNVRKIIEFYENVMTACDQIAAEAKVLKKPRAKKVKPAEELVKKLKFKISDDKLGISSVPATGIIGAQLVAVYNVKTRKIGIYHSRTSDGLSVKGTKITNFTEKSFQKTLRKPDTQMKELKNLNTQKRVEDWFVKSVKTTEIKLNGRINPDIMILKVFK